MYFNQIFCTFVIIFLKNFICAEEYSYLGCFNKRFANVQEYRFDGGLNSCLAACESNYYRYAVITKQRCSCVNNIIGIEINNDLCNYTCIDSVSDFCGGLDAESYYNINLKVPGPPRNLLVGLIRTNTTLILRWDPPEVRQIVSNYVITAQILHTYANYKILSPTWTFPNSSIHAELSNLHPGTKYKFIVTANSDSGSGGSASIDGETRIGIPDPEPEEPKTIKRTDGMILIEINPAINNNGPISSYHVVVHFPDYELLEHFDENYLTNYNQSVESGVPYYIAAELQIKNKTLFTVGDGKTYSGYYNAPLPSDDHVHISIGVVSKTNDETLSRYSITTHEQHVIKEVLVKEEESSSALIIVLWIACVLFGIILISAVIFYIYLQRKVQSQSRLRRLSENHELSVHNSPPVEAEENNGYIYDADEQLTFQQNLKILIDKLEKDQNLPRNSLTLDIDNVIGSGDFGDVIRGNLHKNNLSHTCQVHVISDDMEKPVERKLLKDCNILISLNKNKFLLNFLGICVVPDWMYIVIEDIPYVLKKYLIICRDLVIASKIAEVNILKLMLDITSALIFLSSKNITYKQLCSYNIKVTPQQEIKLSIFGPILNDDKGKSIDITRWSAPEVLKFNNHTIKSDIWSLGCVLWECCCLGGTLYSNVNSGDLFARIKNGARPEQPTFVYDDLYQLLLNTWEINPKERPSFQEVNTTLNQLLTSPKHALSFDLLKSNGMDVLPYFLPQLETK